MGHTEDAYACNYEHVSHKPYHQISSLGSVVWCSSGALHRMQRRLRVQERLDIVKKWECTDASFSFASGTGWCLLLAHHLGMSSRFGIPKCKNSLHLVRSVGFSRQSSTLDQGFVCFCHASHGASAQIIDPSAVIQLYILYTWKIEFRLTILFSFLEMFEFWCRRLQTFQDLNTEAWDSCSRFSVLIQRRKQIHWHSVARVTFPTATLVLILTATRPSTAIWKPWVYSPGWAAKRLPDGKKNWSPHSIYRVTSTSGGRR